MSYIPGKVNGTYGNPIQSNPIEVNPRIVITALNFDQECDCVVTWFIECQISFSALGGEFHSGEVAIIFNIVLLLGLLWRLLAEEIQPGIPHTQHEINKIPLWRVLQRPRARYLDRCVVWLVLRTSSENWASCVNRPASCIGVGLELASVSS